MVYVMEESSAVFRYFQSGIVIAKQGGGRVEMKSHNLKNTVGGFILGVSLLFGIGIMTSMTAQAQYRNDDQWRRNRDYDRDQRQRDDRWNRNRDDRWDRNGRTNDDYPNYGGSFQLRQTALNAGYNEGIKLGRQDRRRGGNYTNSSTYQRATKDYSSRLGDPYLYQRYFRLAFVNGYRAGINGY